MKNTLFIILGLICTSLVLAIPPESQMSFKNNTFSFYSSHELTKTNASIEEAVIVVHGSERNADTYFTSISLMAGKVGKGDSVVVISPHYKLPSDNLLPKEFTWTDEGWLRGDAALNNNQALSFEVIDQFVTLLADAKTFPNLKKIIITGHSAGGQLTQRYAIGSLIENKFPNVEFRYLVLNPGSYAYLNPVRPIAVPFYSNCAFDDYKYGLKNLNKYMSQKSTATLVKNYLERNVVYFLGEKDIVADDIDQDCPARFQGNTRLERGQNFKRILDQEFPLNKHQIFTNPGVAHTQWGMYTSELGKKLLFNP